MHKNLHNLGYVYEQAGSIEKSWKLIIQTQWRPRKKVLGEESSGFGGKPQPAFLISIKRKGNYSKAELWYFNRLPF